MLSFQENRTSRDKKIYLMNPSLKKYQTNKAGF